MHPLEKRKDEAQAEAGIRYQDWFDSIINAKAIQGPEIRRSPKIQRVPEVLLVGENKKHFRPSIVAIGPYHASSKEYDEMSQIKLRLTQKLLSQREDLLQNLYNRLFAKNKQLRDHYAENSTDDWSDDEFTRIMLVDGCFIVYFMTCILDGKRSELEMKAHQVARVQLDLFLVENQIPFLVLREIAELGLEGYSLENINTFLTQSIMAPDDKVGGPVTLLDLLHQKHTQGRNQAVPQEPSQPPLEQKSQKRRGREKSAQMIPQFRNVTELKAKGIHFKVSRSKHVIDITFRKGVLRIPRIIVDDHLKTMALNMIAYEMCPDAPDDLLLTSYICFLDSLIDCDEDVRVLRSANILTNCLSSDEEVAKFFNEIGTNLMPSSSAYAQVKNDIQNYCSNPWNTWWAELKHKYFRNPWSFLALVGALLGLFLAGLGVVLDLWKLESPCDDLCKSIKTTHHL